MSGGDGNASMSSTDEEEDQQEYIGENTYVSDYVSFSTISKTIFVGSIFPFALGISLLLEAMATAEEPQGGLAAVAGSK